MQFPTVCSRSQMTLPPLPPSPLPWPIMYTVINLHNCYHLDSLKVKHILYVAVYDNFIKYIIGLDLDTDLYTIVV